MNNGGDGVNLALAAGKNTSSNKRRFCEVSNTGLSRFREFSYSKKKIFKRNLGPGGVDKFYSARKMETVHSINSFSFFPIEEESNNKKKFNNNNNNNNETTLNALALSNNKSKFKFKPLSTSRSRTEIKNHRTPSSYPFYQKFETLNKVKEFTINDQQQSKKK
jgi:hypothetical protein